MPSILLPASRQPHPFPPSHNPMRLPILLLAILLPVAALADDDLTLFSHLTRQEKEKTAKEMQQQAGERRRRPVETEAQQAQAEARRQKEEARLQKEAADKAAKEEAKRKREDQAIAQLLANKPIKKVLDKANELFWSGKHEEAQKYLLALRAKGRVPEAEALIGRLMLAKAPRQARVAVAAQVAKNLQSLAHLEWQADGKTLSTAAISPERRQAFLVCLRANLMLAMQPVDKAQLLLKQSPWMPTFLGVPFLDGKLAFGNQADWEPLYQAANQMAAVCGDDSQGRHQVEAALLAGDALVLMGRFDEAQKAYGFVGAQTRYFNSRAGKTTYTLGQGDEVATGIPGVFAAQAADHARQLAAIQEILRLSQDYVLWRNAEAQRLGGKIRQRRAEAKKAAELAEKAEKEAARLAKNKHETPVDAAPQDARQGLAAESPFEAAALYQSCRLYLEKGAPAEQKQALAFLEKFIANHPDGLYRGMAHRLLLETALMHRNLKAARQWSAKLEAWIVRARKQKEWEFGQLLQGICAAAGDRVAPPTREWARDSWGNLHPVAETPGQMRHERSAPWVLDDLEDWSARYAGFFLYADGKYDAALKQWERITKLDAAASCTDGSCGPTDFTRLQASAEDKRMMAMEEEAKLFDGNKALKTWLLLGEMWYIGQQFDRAEFVFRSALAGSKGLPESQTDYMHRVLARILYMRRDRNGCMAENAEVFKHCSWTPTEILAINEWIFESNYHADPKVRAQGHQLQERLAMVKSDDNFVLMARLCVGTRLWNEGKKKEAEKWLSMFTPKHQGLYMLAQRVRKNGTWSE